MSDIVILGIGQTPVGEHWETSLRDLAAKAIQEAIADAGGQIRPQALYVGNFLATILSHQANLGSLLADHAHLGGIEAYTVEAAGASGAAAFRVGYMAVASGYVESAVVVGVEKYTDMTGSKLESAAALSTDYDYEGIEGMTPAAQAGLLMRRYMYEYNIPAACFSGLPILAHANAVNNPNAMFRKAITQEVYERAPVCSDPANMFDLAPVADGAAAVLITRSDKIPAGYSDAPVRVLGSACAIDTLALHDRPDPLAFKAAAFSVERACRKAGILPKDVDLFELSDAFSIYGILSLEAAGFAPRGEGWKLAQSGELKIGGRLPVNTMGGLKARGNPLGATGIYQIADAVQQLRGQAGPNQVKDARRAMVQSLGGPASTAITHILEKI